MKKYVCEPCGYVYDPEVGDPDSGIAPGTAFEDLPEDWVCPLRCRKRGLRSRRIRKRGRQAAPAFPLRDQEKAALPKQRAAFLHIQQSASGQRVEIRKVVIAFYNLLKL